MEVRTATGGAAPASSAGHRLALIRPVLGGLVALFAIVALIGFAIRAPQPHDIPLGVVGPPAAIGQLNAAFGARAPGAFDLTTFDTPSAALSAVDDRTVDGAVMLGSGGARLIVAGAAGAAIPGVITGAVGAAFHAQGMAVTVETVHPFSSGDPGGLILFFVVLGLLIASLVAGAQVGLLRGIRWRARLMLLAVFAVGAGLVGMGTAAWIAGGYGSGFWTSAGLVALAASAIASAAAAGARLLGVAGVALGALVLILFNVLASGGPLGTALLPGFYGWLAQGMPASQLYSALRGALFFGGAGVGGPVVVLVAWLIGGAALIALADLFSRAVPGRQPRAARSAA